MGRMQSVSKGWFLILTLSSLLGHGCAARTEKVSGSVVGFNPQTNRVQPILNGRIRFFCGAKVYSGHIFEGQFEVEGLPVGEAKITVESPQAPTAKLGKLSPPWFEIPEEYRDIESTPLIWNIPSGGSFLLVSLAKGTVIEQPISGK